MLDIGKALSEIGAMHADKADEAAALFHAKARETMGKDYIRRLAAGRARDIRVCASDSGFAEIGLSGASFMFAKSIGVLFEYENGRLKSNSYFPSKSGKTGYWMLDAADEAESYAMRDIRRLREEWSILLEMVETGRCSLALFDGSLVPLPSSVPAKESPLHKEFSGLMGIRDRARKAAAKNGACIAGVVKDSRSRRICRMLDVDSSDMLALRKALPEDAATKPLQYSDAIDDVMFSYIRAGRDIPLRIEWFSESNEPVDDIYGLCLLSNYRYPPPLVEADIRSMVRRQEYEIVEKAIRSRFPDLAKRRERRPFR
jgi:hypothetical protein